MSVAEAKTHFSECLREVEGGNPVVITRHGKPVVAIVNADDFAQVERLRAAGLSGGLASVVGKIDDLPEGALEEFVGDVESIARSRRGNRSVPDLE